MLNLSFTLAIGVASTKVVCDGPGDQWAKNVKAATA